MAANNGTAVVANQTFTTGSVAMAVAVLNPANSPQTLWDTGVGYVYASMTTVVTGAPASCTILLEGSQDGGTWVTLATSTSTTGDTQFSTGLVPFTSLRARCSAFSGASTINVYVNVYSSTPAGSTAPISGTVTANQGTRGVASNAWPTYITNQGGTNLASVNSNGGLGICGTSTSPFVGGTLFVQPTDGTNVALVTAATGGSVTGSAQLVSTGNIVAGTSLSAATTGNGTSIDFGSAKTALSAVFIGTGTTSGGTLNLQVSADGASWLNVGTALNASGLAASGTATLATNAISAANVAFRFARAVVATNITGGGTVTAVISAS